MLAKLEDPAAPRHCFCQLPMRALRRWARKRYIEHVPTIELLAEARGPRQQEVVGIVALLDVPDEEVVRLMGPLGRPGCRVLECRDAVKRWLTTMLETDS
jgi:hypothetical protein